MGILNKLFGFRWSLYIVKNKNQLAYAMHEHAVIKIAGYVMGYFADGGKPVEPWGLYLNFNHNHNHKSIKLEPEHFTADGENVTPLLIEQIESIDPGWKVKGGEPVFEEASTKKRIKIQESTSEYLKAAFSNKPRELTFFRVMDEVFDSSSQSKELRSTEFENDDLDDIKSNTPSPELVEWLERRENAFKLRAVMRKSGGHVMLNSSAIDPEELSDPLRTEAIQYLRNQRA